MKSLNPTHALLFAILLLLLANSVRTVPVQAQAEGIYPVHIEPGTRTIRAPDGSAQVLGRVVVDLRNGRIYGFPTLVDSPYPVDTTKSQAPVSKPIYLGQFDFTAMKP
jgi:hypothetical protein